MHAVFSTKQFVRFTRQVLFLICTKFNYILSQSTLFLRILIFWSRLSKLGFRWISFVLPHAIACNSRSNAWLQFYRQFICQNVLTEFCHNIFFYFTWWVLVDASITMRCYHRIEMVKITETFKKKYLGEWNQIVQRKLCRVYFKYVLNSLWLRTVGITLVVL